MHLNWIDFGIILVIGLSILTGLFRGFVRESIALITWALAIWLALHYSNLLDPFLSSYLHDESIRNAVGFLIILFGTLLVGGVVNTLIGFILKSTGLSGTDRLLGMGFGFVRGVAIVALLLIILQQTSLPYQQYRKDSSFYAKFDPVVAYLSGFMPEFITKMKAIDPQEGKDLTFQTES